QDPDEVFDQLKAVLTKDPPWGVKVSVKPHGAVKWWMTDPNGPAFEAAMTALEKGFGKKPAAIGCGGSIGFVGPLADLFGGAPAHPAGAQQLFLGAAAEVGGCINCLVDALSAFTYSDRDLFGIRLALEEAIVNAIRHGHRNDPSKTVHIRFQANAQEFLVEIQ